VCNHFVSLRHAVNAAAIFADREQGAPMHIHATQPNPYAALDALRSAQKTAARREAEIVRQELMESASELAGEAESDDLCIVQADERQESQQHSKRRNRHNQQNTELPPEPKSSKNNQEYSEQAQNHLSDWA
jgi:hypothetical protein